MTLWVSVSTASFFLKCLCSGSLTLFMFALCVYKCVLVPEILVWGPWADYAINILPPVWCWNLMYEIYSDLLLSKCILHTCTPLYIAFLPKVVLLLHYVSGFERYHSNVDPWVGALSYHGRHPPSLFLCGFAIGSYFIMAFLTEVFGESRTIISVIFCHHSCIYCLCNQLRVWFVHYISYTLYKCINQYMLSFIGLANLHTEISFCECWL